MFSRSLRVAGAGLVALDVIISDSERNDALTFAGGTCGNVLSILSFLRWTATPVGFIGSDPAGRRVLADLTTAGVQAAHLIQHSEWNTPVFIQTLEHSKNGPAKHSFVNATNCPHCGQPLADEDATAKIGTTPIRRFAEPERVDVFFMDRLSEDILSLAESARQKGALVFYEPSAKSDAHYWEDAFGLVDIVKYSAERFTIEELEPFIARKTRSLWEVQTDGAKGLRYRRHGSHQTSSTGWTNSAAIPAVRVIDTCGAGDWCSAGLIHGLLTFARGRESGSFGRAVQFGQLLAAWACSFVGARGAMYCNDPQTTWAAINSVVDSRQMDLSRMPFASPSTPPAFGDMHACVASVGKS